MEYEEEEFVKPILERKIQQLYNKCNKYFRELENSKDPRKQLIFTENYNTSDKLFYRIMEADPTNGTHCIWIFDRYKNREFTLDDIEDVRNNIEVYLKNVSKKLSPTLSYKELKDIVQSYEEKFIFDDNNYKMIKEYDTKYGPIQYKVFYDGEYGNLSQPMNKETSCLLGKGTKWCTARPLTWTIPNLFEKYASKGPLYIWVDYKNDNKKYQFYFKEAEFKDELNEDIDSNLFDTFRTEHPILKSLFEYKEKQMFDNIDIGDSLPLINYMLLIGGERDPKVENKLIEKMDINLDGMVKYAYKILSKRWPPEIETILINLFIDKEDIKDAVYYASKVMYSRIEEIEPLLIKSEDPEALVDYAYGALQKRWPNEIEDIIIKNGTSDSIIKYTKYLIGNRWDKAEKELLKRKDTEGLYKYTKDFIGDGLVIGRWPEAEYIILNSDDVETMYNYAARVIDDRWIEAEDKILNSGKTSVIYDYINDVVRSTRWPEGEQALIQSGNIGILLDYITYHPKIINEPNNRENIKRVILDKIDFDTDEFERMIFILSSFLREERWDEFEKLLLKKGSPKQILQYTENIILDRWPEAEPILSKNKKILKQYMKEYNVTKEEMNTRDTLTRFSSNLYSNDKKRKLIELNTILNSNFTMNDIHMLPRIYYGYKINNIKVPNSIVTLIIDIKRL